MKCYRYYQVLDENYNAIPGASIPDATDGRTAVAMARRYIRENGLKSGYCEFHVVTDDGFVSIDHLTEIVIK